MRSALRTLSALLALVPLALTGCDAADPTPVAVAAGVVSNSHGYPVGGAAVTFDSGPDADPVVYTTTTADAEGRFRLEVPPGIYTVVAAARGYNAALQTVTVTPDGMAGLEATVFGPAALSATFVSALTGDAAAGVALQCARERDDATFPDPAVTHEFTATSDEEGQVLVLGAPYGDLRCRASAAPLGTALFDATLSRGVTTVLPPVTVTPPPPPGALRIVLTWGAAPSDLDAHLTGPDGGGGRFHIYYADRAFGPSNLDVDDTSSHGPETVTVVPPSDGTYRFSVHNYSDQGASGAQGIAGSPARVEVHDHEGLVCTYRAPGALQGGNTWRVFEAEARAEGGAFHLDAPCARGAAALPGLGYVLANGAGDAGLFLTGPPPKPVGHR